MKREQLWKCIFLYAMILLAISQAQAGNKRWQGTSGGSWTTGSNWTSGTVPAAGDNVTINSNQSAPITDVPTIALGNLTIGGTCTLKMASTGITLTVSGLSVASTCVLTLDFTGLPASFILTGTGTLTGSIAFKAGSPSMFTVDGTGTIIFSGGRIYDPNLGIGGNFVLASGATLQCTNTGGISTSTSTASDVAVNLGGSYIYSPGASYEYNGTLAQATGNGLPSDITGTLTIHNTQGVTLTQACTVSGSLVFTAGILYPGTNAFTIGTNGTITGANGTSYVDGKLSRVFSAVESKEFPIGKNGNYRHATFYYATLTGTPSTVTIEQVESPFSGTLPAGGILFADRHWHISQSGATAFGFQVTLDPTGWPPTSTPAMARNTGGTTTVLDVGSPQIGRAHV